VAAKQQQLSLPNDPRYVDFVERYADDLLSFAIEVCDIEPTEQQVELFDSVGGIGSRTSVASGHGTGKTSAAGVIVLWHLSCFVMSNTVLTGPKAEVVKSGVWKECADRWMKIKDGPHAWIADHIVIESEKIYIKGFKLQWWAIVKTAPLGRPESLAGQHRRHLLWFADEASGIPDANFGVIGGSLTEVENRFVLASQPTRNTGFFYDTHHRMSKSRGGAWTSLTFNSEDSPLVSDAFIAEKINQYGGSRDDPQYQIKVRGMFPANLEGQLLSRAQLESCLNRPDPFIDSDEWGWVVKVDVAAGEYRDSSVVMVAKVSGNGQYHEPKPRRIHVTKVPIKSNTLQPTALVGEVMTIAGALSNATILIDGGGLGLGVVKRLEEIGVPNVVKVLWGNPCWRTELKDTFFNQRAQAMVGAARAAKAGHLTFAKGAFSDMRHVTELLDQGSRIPYHFDDKARYVIESKGSKAWEGLPSPDMYDCLSFGFLESASFIVSDSAGHHQSPVKEKVLQDLNRQLAAAMGEDEEDAPA
jgi:hypothetical protein